MLVNGVPGFPQDAAAGLSYIMGAGTDAQAPTGGWNPIFAQLDYNLVSNESGSNAWDLASAHDEISASSWWGKVTSADLSKGNNEYYIRPPGPLVGFQNPSDDPYSSDPNTYYLWDFNQVPAAGSTPGIELEDIGTFIGLNGNPTEDPNPASIFYIDFTYRIDLSNDYASDPGVPIYDLQLSLQCSGGSPTISYSSNDGADWSGIPSVTSLTPPAGFTIPVNIPINYSDFNNFIGIDQNHTSPDTNQNYKSNPKENRNVLRFPNPQFGPWSGQAYAILRIKVQLPNGVSLASNYPSGSNISSPIKLNLVKASGSHGIYVHGVRIRSIYAENLYRGSYDRNAIYVLDQNGNNTSQQLCTSLYDCFKSTHSSAGQLLWNSPSTLGFHVGNECNWPAYRCYAYFNEAFRGWAKTYGYQQKNFCDIIANTKGHGNFSYWRPIYEDQSQTNSPSFALQNEAIAFGIDAAGIYTAYNGLYPYYVRPDHDFKSSHINYLFPGDALPSAIKNHLGFMECARCFTGWNGTSYGPTDVLPSHPGDAQKDSDNYTTYTWRYQDAVASAANTINTFCAHGSYPQTNSSSLWGSYYYYPSTFESIFATYAPQSFNTDQLQVNLLGALESGTWQQTFPWSLFASNISLSSTELNNIENALKPGIRPNSAPEIREMTWEGLSWGAKGIAYNPIGGGGPANIGFCGNSWEDQFNCGFSDINPPISSPPTWQAGTYSPGQWVSDNPTSNGIPTYYLCIAATSHEPPSAEWESNASYNYYGYISISPSTGYVLPPATSASQVVRNTNGTLASPCFPDHEIVFPCHNAYFLWIPCFSDFDVWDGPSSNPNSNKILSVNDPVTSTHISAYLSGLQNYNNGWSTPSSDIASNTTYINALVNYYSQFLTTNPAAQNSDWKPQSFSGGCGWPEASHPDIDNGTAWWSNHSVPGTLTPGDPAWNDPNNPHWDPSNGRPQNSYFSDWIAGDRELDNSTPWGGVTPPHRFNLAQYTGYWSIPFRYPASPSVSVSLTGVPTYYGLNDRSNGVKRAMADIAPIARELKQLRWHNTMRINDAASPFGSDFSNWPTDPSTDARIQTDPIGNYIAYDVNQNTDWYKFPIMENIFSLTDAGITSGGGGGHTLGDDSPPTLQDRMLEKFRRFDFMTANNPEPYTSRDPGQNFEDISTYIDYSSAADGPEWFDSHINSNRPWQFDLSASTQFNESRLLEIGAFSDDNEPDANYVTILNTRTWPIIYDNPLNPASIQKNGCFI